MSKEYICKLCLSNNHGWCKERKGQVSNYKSLNECEYRKLENTVEYPTSRALNKETNTQTTSKGYSDTDDSRENVGRLLEVGNVIGKREMLLYIQRACIANGGTLNLEEICKYDQVCRIQEGIFKVEEHEGMIQGDIRKESIFIAENQLKVIKNS